MQVFAADLAHPAVYNVPRKKIISELVFCCGHTTRYLSSLQLCFRPCYLSVQQAEEMVHKSCRETRFVEIHCERSYPLTCYLCASTRKRSLFRPAKGCILPAAARQVCQLQGGFPCDALLRRTVTCEATISRGVRNADANLSPHIFSKVLESGGGQHYALHQAQRWRRVKLKSERSFFDKCMES